MTLEPEKRPLLPGIAAGVGGVVTALRWPPTFWRDVTWGALVLVMAASLAWCEFRYARSGRPLPLLRNVAIGIGVIGLAQLVWLAARH